MEQRKDDHIRLALSSQIEAALADGRFFYEPMLGSHLTGQIEPFNFLGKTFRVPFWVSSMTGGTAQARAINANLARACREFGMGMGLGSCRILLDNPAHLPDFDMRDLIGDDLPLFANIGIVQLEEMVAAGTTGKLAGLVALLRADGLIIHVNPVQEWIQAEGDVIKVPPIETIARFLELTDIKVIVKEVGQGMGPESLRHLLDLPVEAIEFAAFGGTSFARVELSRSPGGNKEHLEPLAMVGHTAGEMLDMINTLESGSLKPRCRQVIISGGIRSFLDGYYHLSKSQLPCVYGQASGFLRHARGEYRDLQQYVAGQISGLRFAKAFLKVRP